MSSIRELSYDFPVASTSASASSYSSQSQRKTKRATSPRRIAKARLPPVPRWELATLDDDELDLDREEEERDYAALGYPTRRAPSPHVYPYTSATSAYSGYPYTTRSTNAGYTSGYSTPSPYDYDAYAAPPMARSCDSASSALSSCSSSSSHSSREGRSRCAKKIRKPRSVSPPACESYPSYPYTTSPALSLTSSPYFVDDVEFEDDVEEESCSADAPTEHKEPASMALKKQWVALSLRVQFGVFRAKRRMRNRIISL